MTVFFKRQQHRKLSWLDKDSDKNQNQFDSIEHMLYVSGVHLNFRSKLALKSRL
jgi:hypothetical protein